MRSVILPALLQLRQRTQLYPKPLTPSQVRTAACWFVETPFTVKNIIIKYCAHADGDPAACFLCVAGRAQCGQRRRWVWG